MGSWAKARFGKEIFAPVGIIVAGSTSKEMEKEILKLFDKVIHTHERVAHYHLVKKGKHEIPIIFNVYGAPATVDAIVELHDGGCRNVLFFGNAYGGFQNTPIGTLVLPTASYHFDGIYHPVHPDRDKSLPDKQLKAKLELLLKKNKLAYEEGVNISVPAVTFQLPHANKHYLAIKPKTCEMELAACLSRASDVGVRAAAVLVISDNRDHHIRGEKKKDTIHDSKIHALKTIIHNIDHFNLPALVHAKKFNVHTYLAGIIEDPNDPRNVYKLKDQH